MATLIVFFAIGGFIYYCHKRTNTQIVITTGGKTRPYYKSALKYAGFLEKNRVAARVTDSKGAIENLQRLTGSNPEANVALVQGGVVAGLTQRYLIEEADAPTGRRGILTALQNGELRSMGRVLTEPLWVFYDCRKDIRTLKDFRRKRILVGEEGSGTRDLATQLLKAHGVDANNSNWLARDATAFLKESPSGEYAAADAGFLVVAANLRDKDQDIKQLAQKKCLLNITDADGLVQRLPFLHKVVLHRGAFDLENTIPKEDVTLVATKAALVVRKDLDPALQNLLAQAVLQAQSSTEDNPKFFPLASSTLMEDNPELPLSTEARRVYGMEQTFFQRLLPFWIATFLDDVILYILALPFITILFQAFRVIPITHGLLIRHRCEKMHRELSELEAKLGPSASPGIVAEVEEEFARAARKVREMPLPETDRFHLRRHIELVRRHIESAKRQNPRMAMHWAGLDGAPSCSLPG